MVGNRTHEELESDWLNHFKDNNPTDRPSAEWLTCPEMAVKAGVTKDAMRYYLERNKSSYDSMEGAIQSSGRRVVARLYKFKK